MTQAPSPADPPSDVDHAVARLAGLLKIARVLLDDDRRIDLAGLENEVGRLCAAVLDIDPKRARTLRPRLTALLTEIESIEAKLITARAVPTA